jgi:hypothetical protein
VNLAPDKREVVLADEAVLLERLREEVDALYSTSRNTFHLAQGVSSKTNSNNNSANSTGTGSSGSGSGSSSSQTNLLSHSFSLLEENNDKESKSLEQPIDIVDETEIVQSDCTENESLLSSQNSSIDCSASSALASASEAAPPFPTKTSSSSTVAMESKQLSRIFRNDIKTSNSTVDEAADCTEADVAIDMDNESQILTPRKRARVGDGSRSGSVSPIPGSESGIGTTGADPVWATSAESKALLRSHEKLKLQLSNREQLQSSKSPLHSTAVMRGSPEKTAIGYRSTLSSEFDSAAARDDPPLSSELPSISRGAVSAITSAETSSMKEDCDAVEEEDDEVVFMTHYSHRRRTDDTMMTTDDESQLPHDKNSKPLVRRVNSNNSNNDSSAASAAVAVPTTTSAMYVDATAAAAAAVAIPSIWSFDPQAALNKIKKKRPLREKTSSMPGGNGVHVEFSATSRQKCSSTTACTTVAGNSSSGDSTGLNSNGYVYDNSEGLNMNSVEAQRLLARVLSKQVSDIVTSTLM